MRMTPPPVKLSVYFSTWGLDEPHDACAEDLASVPDQPHCAALQYAGCSLRSGAAEYFMANLTSRHPCCGSYSALRRRGSTSQATRVAAHTRGTPHVVCGGPDYPRWPWTTRPLDPWPLVPGPLIHPKSPGPLDSGSLELWTLEAWSLDHWTPGPWKRGLTSRQHVVPKRVEFPGSAPGNRVFSRALQVGILPPGLVSPCDSAAQWPIKCRHLCAASFRVEMALCTCLEELYVSVHVAKTVHKFQS